MRKKVGKVLAVFLCICTLLTMSDLPIRAYTEGSGSTSETAKVETEQSADPGVTGNSEGGIMPADAGDDAGSTTGALTMENYALKWVSGSSKTVIDGNTMTTTPATHSEVSVKAQLTYSCGGNEGVDTGKSEIRLPLYLYYDRNGNPIGRVELSIPKAPATGGATSFNYYIDDHGTPDDKSDDEIVITNYKPIPEGGFFMKADITWKYDPIEVSNGYTNDQVQATFKTQGNGGGAALTGSSDKLTTTVNTKAEGYTPSKAASKKHETWKSEWGPKPADAEDYYYVVWTVREQMKLRETTAPYSLYIEEMPGAVAEDGSTVDGDPNKGEVVAWANYSFYSSGNQPTANGTGKTTDFKVGTQAEMAAEPAYVATNSGEVNNSMAYVARDIVMRYPKSALPEDETKVPTIYNGAKVTIKTADGEITEKVALNRYVYQRVSLGVVYPGDTFSMYKRQRAGYSLVNFKDKATSKGGLSMLWAGLDVEMDWSIDVKNMSWTRTENGTKEYDTVLRDGNMYVAGERLLPGDYELSKFYPAQYDIYMPGYNEDTGYFLGISGDYEQDYAPIKVEVKDAAGNWSEYGQVVKTGANTYRWEGIDGTTSTGTYTATNSSSNGKSAIALPAGTQDIRFTHHGKPYGVEYRMGLYYNLKPSEHLMGLIGEDTTTFNLININEAWGEQDGQIYTTGNTFNNTSTPGIKADIESQDTAEFGGTNRVAHDYAEHVFEAIKPSASYSKRMSTPVNETGAQRVRIPVELVWDYYYGIASIGMSLQDAIALNLIPEARDGVFYDLLPAGVTVDLRSIVVQTYSTRNCDGKIVPNCEYTVEMVDNWRDSGRTMMILHVQAPEGYRNFADSTSYCDTGFRVKFNMYDSWDNIEANGVGVKNDSAYVSKDGSVPNGVSDTGVGSADKALFENLGGDGGDQELKNNVRYASDAVTVDVPRAAQMGFSKRVKGAADTGYTSSTTIPAGGEYSYQMRYALQDHATAKSVVLYDVLETAYDQNPHWSGTFRGINVKQIQQQFPEIDVKVYYSTSKTFGNLQVSTGIDYTDLTNTEMWSTTAPDDLSKVTAVAVDLSTNKDGSEVMFTGPVALSAEVQMTAPTDAREYLDDPETADDETVYAYNQAFIKQGNEKPEGSETTTVSLKNPEIQITKLSNPVTGTKVAPRNVPVGSNIEYTLRVTNKNGADTIEQVKVEDVIPDGLEIDTAALSFYFGSHSGNKALADGSGRILATVDGQKVTFSIDKISAKEVINLVIPVKVKEDTAGGTRFDNKARITEFNGEEWDDEYESNETNHQVTNVKLALPVSKKFTGQSRPTKKTFQFKLEGLNGAPMPAGENADTLNITDGATNRSFGAIVFTKAGDYQYTVTEVNGGETGYTYDDTVHHITAHVYEDNGVLRVSWTDAEAKAGDNGKITFTNDYKPVSTEFSIPVEKILGGDPVPAGHTEDFEFVLTPGVSTNPMPADGKTKLVISGLDSSENNKDKTASYDKITFTKAGTYVYTIKETIGDTPGYQYAYDISTHTVTLKVTDNNGQLECVWLEQTAQNRAVTFRNDYEPTADIVSLQISKQVTGNDRVPGNEKSFTFELSQPEYEGDYDYAANNEALPMPESTTTTIVDSGTAEIGQIAIKHAGKYTYTIREVNSNAAGYTYDTNVCKAIVTVVDHGGVLEATIAYQFQNQGGADVTATQFVNTYKPAETSTAFTIEKTVTGDVPANNQKTFTFKVEPVDGAPMPENGGDTVTITGAGTATMENVGPYKKAGIYTYKISEVEGTDGGYTYSTDQYTVTVTVEDQDGVLVATQEIRKDGVVVDAISFENQYEATATEYAPVVSKVITGNARPEEQKQDFTFILEAIGNAPMPANGGEICTITDEGEGVFGTIPYTKVGTYQYRITEQGGTAEGYSYSQNECTLTVSVTDEEGVLVATPSYQNTHSNSESKAEFTNNYTPSPVSTAITVNKSIVGNERPEDKEKTFTFLLTGKNGAPMPTAANGDRAEITDEGSADFKTIRFTEAGVYHYEVQEVDDGLLGYTYSSDVYDVTVTVFDNSGILETDVRYEKNGVPADQILFENEYHPEAFAFELPVEKILEGDKPSKDATFTFELKGEDDAPMPEKATAEIQGAGKTGFGTIVFTEAGTYRYTVTETPGDAEGYSYDSRSYTVEVTVTDYDGLLEATWTVDGEEDGSVVFTNTYTAPKTEITTSHGGVNTGDAGNMGGWLLLAGGAFLVLLGIRRMRRNDA